MTAARAAVAARLAAFGAIALWGVSFVATKAVLREMSPVTLIFTRFALGTLVLFAILRFRRQLVIPPRDTWRTLALMGFVGIFVHQMLQVHGLALTTAIRTGWLIGLIPIWSALLAAAFLGESFGPRKVTGLLLGLAGAVLVMTRGELSSDVLALPTTRGDLLILASTVNWAIYTILGRHTLKRLGSAKATAAAMFVGWAMLIPFFVDAAGWYEYRSLSPTGLLAIVFLGVGCSGLGYLFWYMALERVDASQVAAFLYLEPLVTLVAAVALLGESIVLSTVFGGVLVLIGVAAVQSAPSAAPPHRTGTSRMNSTSRVSIACLSVVLVAGSASAQSDPRYIRFEGVPSSVKGALYMPDAALPAPHVGIVVTHRTSNFMNALACTELSRRGFAVLCMNPGSDNNDYVAEWINRRY